MSEHDSTAPVESGSAETQVASDQIVALEPTVITPFERDPLLEHSKGLVGDSDRRTVANVDLGWAKAAIHHYAVDRESVRQELAEVRCELDQCKESHASANTRIEVLLERVKEYSRLRRSTQVLTSIGAGLVGLGIGNWSKESPGLSLLLLAVGLSIVVLASWISPKGDAQ